MANLFKSLTSFSLLRFHIEVKASHTQVTCSCLEDMDVSFTPPLLFPHKLSTYCSRNKSAVFIFCPAVRQLNGQINDRRKAIYTFCSRGVCVSRSCRSVCVFLSVSLHLCMRGSSAFQVYRRFVVYPVIMARRYTHYVSQSMRHCSNPLGREKAD